MIPNIVYLRAIAATAVLLYHTSFYYAHFTADQRFLSVFNGRYGYFGVSLFFCISGYLMAYLQERDRFGSFVSARVLRIYPIYLIATAGALLLTYLRAGVVPDVTAAGLSLLPLGQQPRPLGIEWTLVYEMFYYGVVSLFTLPWFKPFFKPFLVLWLVAVLGNYAVTGSLITEMQPTLGTAFLAVHTLCFVAGALLRAFRVERVFHSWLAVPLGLYAMSTFSLLPVATAKLAVGPVAVLAIFGMAVSCRDLSETRYGRLPAMVLKRLGDWSYALYLVHATVLIAVIETAVLRGARGAMLWGGAFIAGLAIGSLWGVLDVGLHRVVRSMAGHAGALVRSTWWNRTPALHSTLSE